MDQQRRNGMGSGGYCVCVKCGEKVPHRRGVRCLEERCPQCGKAMLREGSEHHREVLERKSG